MSRATKKAKFNAFAIWFDAGFVGRGKNQETRSKMTIPRIPLSLDLPNH
jgi:hypothetical protein